MADCATTANARQYPGFATSSCLRHEPLEREIVELAPGVWAFIGYGSSNFGVIATQHGYLLIDTGDDLPGAKAAKAEIARLAPGSLQAIILTHSHPDHRGAAEIFLEGASDVPVWAHPEFGSETRNAHGLGDILKKRFEKQFGINIPDAEYTPNFVLPHVQSGKLLAPNRSVAAGRTRLDMDGVQLEIYTIPSETDDHLAIWLPQKKVLFVGDAVYGMFPNLSPLRGGSYRDVERWAASIRKLMEFDADAAMCGHKIAPAGADVRKIFGDTAEALEYLYKETIEGMNAGLGPDELVASIQLPEHLRNAPWLGEYYGPASYGIRSIFAEKIGWFDDDATSIVPLDPAEEAERMIALAGGEQKLLAAATRELADGDYIWAAKLAGYLRQSSVSKEARNLKADALEALSDEIMPMAPRNYLKASALELRGKA